MICGKVLRIDADDVLVVKNGIDCDSQPDFACERIDNRPAFGKQNTHIHLSINGNLGVTFVFALTGMRLSEVSMTNTYHKLLDGSVKSIVMDLACPNFALQI